MFLIRFIGWLHNIAGQWTNCHPLLRVFDWSVKEFNEYQSLYISYSRYNSTVHLQLHLLRYISHADIYNFFSLITFYIYVVFFSVANITKKYIQFHKIRIQETTTRKMQLWTTLTTTNECCLNVTAVTASAQNQKATRNPIQSVAQQTIVMKPNSSSTSTFCFRLTLTPCIPH